MASLSKALKAAGGTADSKALRKELLKGIQRASRPLKEAAQSSARANLPQSGGLAETVGQAKFRTKTISGGKRVGVRVVATGKHNIRAMDRGRLRHPVFGNRAVWVEQSIKPGWFSDAIQDGAPRVRAEIVLVMESVADRLEASV